MNKKNIYFYILLFAIVSIISLIIVYFFLLKNSNNPYSTYTLNTINKITKKVSDISIFEKLNKNEPDIPKRDKKDLSKEFNELVNKINNINTNYSIYINDLYSEKIYLHNEKQNYYAASLYKIPIAVSVLKQVDFENINLFDTLTYKPYHSTIGTGFINEGETNIDYTYDQLLKALLKNSDNTAQTMLQEKFNINSIIMSSAFPNVSINYSKETKLDSNTNLKTNFYHINESNSYEIGEYLSFIYTSNYLSVESKKYLFDTMKDTQFDDYFANYLNQDYSNKIGLSKSSIHNCGLITNKDIVVCVMSEYTNKNQFIEITKIIAEFINNL